MKNVPNAPMYKSFFFLHIVFLCHVSYSRVIHFKAHGPSSPSPSDYVRQICSVCDDIDFKCFLCELVKNISYRLARFARYSVP